MNRRIGTITVIITNRTAQAAQVNAVLAEYGDAIIGRMGLPYAPKKLHIIALIVFMPPPTRSAPCRESWGHWKESM